MGSAALERSSQAWVAGPRRRWEQGGALGRQSVDGAEGVRESKSGTGVENLQVQLRGRDGARQWAC